MPDLLELLNDPPLVHEGGSLTWGLDPRVLEFLNRTVDRDQITLETGAGLSTVVFALRGSTHHTIVPDGEEASRISAYCARKGIQTDRLSFHLGYSEELLPGLDVGALDLVLIDGCHGFPSPFIDWYYTAAKLRVGALLIVDDVQIWTCRLLSEFLRHDAGWEFCGALGPRTDLFRKTAAFEASREWSHQEFVRKRSRRWILRYRLLRGLELLRNGQIREVVRRLRS